MCLEKCMSQKLCMTNNFPSNNVISSADHIEIVEAGDYQIQFMVNVNSTVTSDIGVMVQNNGILIPGAMVALCVNSFLGALLCGTAIVTLEAGALLELVLISSEATRLKFDGSCQTTAYLTVLKLK